MIWQDKMYESEADARRKIEKLTTYTQNLIKAVEKKELERDQVFSFWQAALSRPNVVQPLPRTAAWCECEAGTPSLSSTCLNADCDSPSEKGRYCAAAPAT